MTTQSKMTGLEKLTDLVKHEIQMLEASMADFAERFAKDPSYTLSWNGDSTYRDAAKLEVYRTLEALLKDGLTLDAIRDEMQTRAQRAANELSSSTSQTTNLYNNCKRHALAELFWGHWAPLKNLRD